MQADMSRRRVLVAAGASAVFSLRNLFAHERLQGWEPVEADSFAQARFIMQHHPCEVVLVNEDLLHQERQQGLAWLAQPHEAPLIVLAGDNAQTVAQAYEQGAHMCIGRDLAMTCPPVLAAALTRAAGLADVYRGAQRAHTQLAHSRRHVDRLVHLIWRTTPVEGDAPWGTQRYTLERLQEEVARTQRHGGPLTVAVGEVLPPADQPESDTVLTWTSHMIAQAKRRCDVAGQYGMRGFLLLMVLTPKAGALTCCKRLQRMLQAPPKGKGPVGPLRAYFGLAACNPENTTPQALLRLADQHLVMAKTGKGEGIVAE